MDWPGEIRNFNVRLPAELHKTVKREAGSRDITVERAYREALERWLESIQAGSSGRTEVRHSEDYGPVNLDTLQVSEEKWVSYLLAVLRGPSQKAKKAICENLEAFAELTTRTEEADAIQRQLGDLPIADRQRILGALIGRVVSEPVEVPALGERTPSKPKPKAG